MYIIRGSYRAYGDYAGSLLKLVVKGLLGSIYGVLTMALPVMDLLDDLPKSMVLDRRFFCAHRLDQLPMADG